MRTVEYTIAIKDENGNILSETKYSKKCDIPLKEEIDRHTYDGLRGDLDKLEKAVIGTRTGAEKEFVTSILQEDNEIKKKPKN